MKELDTFEVEVLQFHLPNGRSSVKTTNLPVKDKLDEKYRKMTEQGYQFEAEVLTTGDISVTISTTGLEEDYDVDIKACENGPEVQDMMVEMLEGLTL